MHALIYVCSHVRALRISFICALMRLLLHMCSYVCMPLMCVRSAFYACFDMCTSSGLFLVVVYLGMPLFLLEPLALSAVAHARTLPSGGSAGNTAVGSWRLRSGGERCRRELAVRSSGKHCRRELAGPQPRARRYCR